MRPIDLSEFSYGYAVTEALVKTMPGGVQAAPLFPSLKKEGQPGYGYDVALEFSGFLLFFQFKLSDQMERRSALETKDGFLEPYFFRMHLRASAHSDQHQLLIDLEATQQNLPHEVYYAAPLFHTSVQLNEAYRTNSVVDRTVFFRPSDIGALPDSDPHWVSFADGSNQAYFYSPRGKELGDIAISGDVLLKGLLHRQPKQFTEASFRALGEQMEEVVVGRYRPTPRRPRARKPPQEVERERAMEYMARLLVPEVPVGEGPRVLEEQVRAQLRELRATRDPREVVSYMARAFFGTEVVAVVRG